MTHAIDALVREMKKKKSAVCVGLDPFWDQIPVDIREDSAKKFGNSLTTAAFAIVAFNRLVIDAVADLVPAVKPQFALYLRFGTEGVYAFAETVKYAKEKGLLVIADAKSNDIDTSMEGYAEGFLGSFATGGEEFSPFDADLLTVNPYLGGDTFRPLLKVIQRRGKGAFVLAKTSNKSAGELQDKLVDGEPLWAKTADIVGNHFAATKGESGYLAAGLVVGATMPEQLRILRKKHPELFFLIPGYGAQGGDATALREAAGNNAGFIVNSSRGILYAYQKPENAGLTPDGAMKKAVREMNEELSPIIGL